MNSILPMQELLQEPDQIKAQQLRLDAAFQGDFDPPPPTTTTSKDLINGTVAQAMRSVVHGLAPADHGRNVAASVLRGLGMSHSDAAEVARRPLPPFPLQAQQGVAGTSFRVRAAVASKEKKVALS